MCPSDPYYASDIPQRAFDAEKAKSLVQSSGKGSAEILLNTANTAPSIVELATAYCQQAQAVGINMKLNKIDPSVYFGPDAGNVRRRQASGHHNRFQSNGRSASSPSRRLTPLTGTTRKSFRCSGKLARRPMWRNGRISSTRMQQIQYDRGTMVIPVVPNQVDVYSPKIGGYATEPLSIYPRVETLWLKSGSVSQRQAQPRGKVGALSWVPPPSAGERRCRD